MPTPDLPDREYVALADFRHQLRRFLAFSEERARTVGLEPRQHQLLLALRGLPAGVAPTVGALAERLLLRHHTVVELLDRLEKRGLIGRTRDAVDRRQARLTITARGKTTLRRLSLAHHDELATVGPDLVKALRRVLGEEVVSAPNRSPDGPWSTLGDFTSTPRIIPISLLAIAIGVLSGFVALALLKLIGLFTNLFFFQRWGTAMASPADHHLGWLVVVVPVLGGLIIGFIARFGSERIRGHGIPEALESIMLRGSRVEPALAILKPLSAAISIGSGGPFGAEGPIIMTGGAFGSLVAQGFHLTSAERKTLLVAGAAGGMAATFGTPLAATLLAIELLLFEWKPRSFIPVALAAAAAMATRNHLFAPPPLFPVPHHADFFGLAGLLAAAVCGLGAGMLSMAMTASVYLFEDLFKRLPFHWMWWPAIGGLVIGIGGLIDPHALGVGYDSIQGLLDGKLAVKAIVVLVIVKWTIWAFSLGSGTSGGVLAPLLMIGGALGALLGHVLPDEGTGFWALICMGAILGGTMRSPLTGIIFAAEVSHDWGALVPLTIAAVIAHGFTVLTLKRSILTEKVARRGYHITREYAIDPLEVLFVRDVCAPPGDPVRPPPSSRPLTAEFRIHLDDTLRTVAYRMASADVTSLPIVDDAGWFVGELTLADVLKARLRHLEEETRRERGWRRS